MAFPWTRAGSHQQITSLFVGAGILHLLAVGIAGFLVIARSLQPVASHFEVHSKPRLAAQIQHHREMLREIEAAQPPPSFHKLLQLPHDLPLALPQTPAISEQLPFPNEESYLEHGGEGWGRPWGLSYPQGTAQFFGISTSEKRILILYDISKTVVNAAARSATSMESIREETRRLLRGLSIQCRFGIGQFARNYAFFEEELVPVTETNRRRAEEWLDRWFATTGTMPSRTPRLVTGSPGFLKVLDAGFRMNPEVLYIISDGNFYQGVAYHRIVYKEIARTLEVLQRSRLHPVKIHFLALGMRKEAFCEMQTLLSQVSGTLQKLK